jgi:hypothetical protein
MAVNDHINGIGIGLIHGREIGVFGEHDAASAGMLLQIFLDRLLGFGNVNGQNDQSPVGEFLVDGLDERLFLLDQVVQNSSRTTLPFTDSLLKLSPAMVLARKRGAGLSSSSPAKA